MFSRIQFSSAPPPGPAAPAPGAAGDSVDCPAGPAFEDLFVASGEQLLQISNLAVGAMVAAALSSKK